MKVRGDDKPAGKKKPEMRDAQTQTERSDLQRIKRHQQAKEQAKLL
jgi:hypothetical protein